jgi:hypothetical protein
MYLWFTLFSSLLSDHASLTNSRDEQQMPIIRGVKNLPSVKKSDPPDNPSTSFLEQTKAAFKVLNKDSSPVLTDVEGLSKYTSNIQKECLPGRDDSNGEINPNSNRNRECLRFVQKNSKPRVGIMITPGFITNALGHWFEIALLHVMGGSVDSNQIEVIVNHHVPVYGYGKSHGFSKLIRITLPLPLAIMDAFLYEKLREETQDSAVEALDSSMLKRELIPTKSEIASIIKLVMRWQCRLSHVSAHTSMISVSLNDVLKDPISTLQQIIQFVFSNNWEWEGGNTQVWKDIDAKKEASEFVDWETTRIVENESKQLLNKISLVQEQVENALDTKGELAAAVQDGFKEEMELSEDMSHWPCPSFWAGVEQLKMNSALVPDCRDDHPWIKCTINRDKCEVKKDPECN